MTAMQESYRSGGHPFRQVQAARFSLRSLALQMQPSLASGLRLLARRRRLVRLWLELGRIRLGRRGALSLLVVASDKAQREQSQEREGFRSLHNNSPGSIPAEAGERRPVRRRSAVLRGQPGAGLPGPARHARGPLSWVAIDRAHEAMMKRAVAPALSVIVR